MTGSTNVASPCGKYVVTGRTTGTISVRLVPWDPQFVRGDDPVDTTGRTDLSSNKKPATALTVADDAASFEGSG